MTRIASGFEQSQFDGFTYLWANTFLGFQTAQLERVTEKIFCLRFREGIQNEFSRDQTMFDHDFNLRVASPKTSHSNRATRIPDHSQKIDFQITLRVKPEVFVASAPLEFEWFSKFDFGDRRGRQGLTWQAGNQKRDEDYQNRFHASSLNLEQPWSVNFL
jgi:hypothetical protein